MLYSIDERCPINLFWVFAKFSIVVQIFFIVKNVLLDYLGCLFYMLIVLSMVIIITCFVVNNV